MKYFKLIFIFLLLISCGDEEAFNKVVYPCENEIERELSSSGYKINLEILSNNLSLGYRVSDKYIVINGDFQKSSSEWSYRYMIVDVNSKDVRFFERPYSLNQILSESKLYQIREDQLFLARLDEDETWKMEIVNLLSGIVFDIPIQLFGESPKQIFQVEKHNKQIYILAEYDDRMVLYQYNNEQRKLDLLYSSTNELKTIGFKIISDDLKKDYLIRLSDNNIGQTIMEKIDIETSEIIYSKIFDGILRNHNYPYSQEILPIDENGMIFLNFEQGNCTLVSSITGEIVRQYNMEVVPLSNEYSIDFVRNTRGEVVIVDVFDRKLGKPIVGSSQLSLVDRFELFDKNQLYIGNYLGQRLISIETGCAQYINGGPNGFTFDVLKFNDNEFILVGYDEIVFYQL